MTAAALSLYSRTSLPQRLQALAVLAYALVLGVFVSAGRPGLGIGEGFFIPVILVALGGTVVTGTAAGLAAAALYELGLVLAHTGAGLFSMRIVVHLLGYVAAGALVGSFAHRARLLLAEALQVLDDLLHLARRDTGTGLLDKHGLDRALSERISRRIPFTLVVGEISAREEGAVRSASQAMLRELGPAAEIARIGPSHLAVITEPASPAGARAAAQMLERAVDRGGMKATFGWAVHPSEGTDGWSLFRAASERLYARRIVRGEWTPTAASAGLVDELPLPRPL